MLTEKERDTRQKYDAQAEEWLEHSGGNDRDFWRKEMNLFVSLLHKGDLVIEVGSGPATDGKHLIKHDLRCVSTDYSRGMLQIAQNLNTNPKLVQMDMQEPSFRANTFNGFWASACLLHLENPLPALKKLNQITRPNGFGFISMKEGKGEKVDPKTGYYFKYYRSQEFEKILEQAHLHPILINRRPGSPEHDWLTYFVRVRKW